VLGSPLPMKSEKEQVFEDGQSFEFRFEVGLAPQFEVNPSVVGTVPYYLVKVDDKMVENDISDLQRRYGKFSSPEVSAENHILYGDFEELDENGNVKEGGNKTTTTLSIEMIKDEEHRKPFIGLKKDESVVFNPMKSLSHETEVAAMLRADKSSPQVHADYKFTVRTINQIDKAELNPELFDKIYGEGIAKSEEEFRQKIKEGIAAYFDRDSNTKLKKDLRARLVSEINFALPDDFLKRMLKSTQEKEMSEDEFEHQYYHIAEDLRWDMIRNRVARANNISIDEEELKNTARMMARQQFAQYGYNNMEESKIEEVANSYLAERDNAERIERAILDDKVFAQLKTEVPLDMIELPYEEFIKKLNEKTEHEVEHHH
jgi:trigger factor